MITEWALKWGIPQEAVVDLIAMSNPTGLADTNSQAASEAGAQVEVRLEASRAGGVLWRNNVGVLPGANGKPVRYGLANDSKAVNMRTKSSDLVGIKPIIVTPDMVGRSVGIFLAREIKEPGWRYTGKGREKAQLNFINIVNSMGGDAKFATGRGTI